MYRNFFKRLIDIILCLIALPFFLLIFAVIAPMIYFSDRGSVFYNAPRLGKDGRIFKMYKFRSMKMNAPDIRNADGSTFNSEDDPRLTKVGRFIRKTSLDEVPQLLNVLKGDMSIVGPRPDLPEHKEMYEGDEFRKLEVRPGITGYAQAYVRNTVPWKERLARDVWYVDNVSFVLDVKIIVKTATSVLSRKNIYITDGATVGKGNDK
ncbi:MAG: sugar transferase [Clostridia bacterium]|nr:sugar transferase [Clostridia bacterium]